MGEILLAIAQGIGTLFVNPVFYLLVVGLFLFSAQRVRRERRSFNVKAYGMFNTIFRSIAPSLLMGLLGSALLVGIGAALPTGVTVLISCMYLLIMLTGQLRFLSPAIAVGLGLIATWLFPDLQTANTRLNLWIDEIRGADLYSVAVFLAAGTLIEALLVAGWGARQTSPRQINSRRGSKVGAHEAGELWIVPLFLLVPSAGPFDASGWWPVIAGGASFGLALFPVGVGLSQLITHTLPELAVRETARWLLLSAGVTTALVGAAFLLRLEVLAVCAGLFACIFRLTLIWYHHHLRETRPFYFILPRRGLRVIDVLPNSLADRLGIRPGERILRVNDQEVDNEYAFYQALQTHAAYCKIEVIDRFGEPRFAKGSIHQDDDYKIGLLFLEPGKWNRYAKTKS